MRNAVFSSCGRYRYELRRKIPCALRWVRPLVCIGLNPSVAGEVENDPTIRRLIDFATRWSCSDLIMINLFAWISPDPKALRNNPDAHGPDNNKWTDGAMAESAFGIALCAWGANKEARPMARQFIGLYGKRYKLSCLAQNKDGSPKHPLYCRADLEPIPFMGTP